MAHFSPCKIWASLGKPASSEKPVHCPSKIDRLSLKFRRSVPSVKINQKLIQVVVCCILNRKFPIYSRFVRLTANRIQYFKTHVVMPAPCTFTRNGSYACIITDEREKTLVLILVWMFLPMRFPIENRLIPTVLADYKYGLHLKTSQSYWLQKKSKTFSSLWISPIFNGMEITVSTVRLHVKMLGCSLL